MQGDEGLKPGGAENGVSHAGRWRIKNHMSWKFVFCRGTRQELEQKKDRRDDRRSNNFTNVSFYLWAPYSAYSVAGVKVAKSPLANGSTSIRLNSSALPVVGSKLLFWNILK